MALKGQLIRFSLQQGHVAIYRIRSHYGGSFLLRSRSIVLLFSVLEDYVHLLVLSR